jgi:hypothetical protein
MYVQLQYLNYLLEKETWELVFKQTSVNDAYSEFLGISQYYYDMAVPRKRVKIKQPKNKWITSDIRVSSIKLRFLNRLMKQIHQKNFKNTIVGTKKYITVISEAGRITNNMRINTSGNKAKAMWDPIKEELGILN